jgi:putative membrane protein
MKTNKLLITVAFIALSVQACKKDNENYQVDNQSFVTQASSSNNFEIQAGGIAMLRGQSDAVKHYGEHMVTDHTTVGNEMKSLAASKGWMVPVALQQKEQANLDLITRADAASFDREFMRIMVASHQDAVNLFSNASGDNGVYDADLRAFAAGKLPSLQGHLDQAITLQAQVK